jgi:hypothetical protein
MHAAGSQRDTQCSCVDGAYRQHAGAYSCSPSKVCHEPVYTSPTIYQGGCRCSWCCTFQSSDIATLLPFLLIFKAHFYFFMTNVSPHHQTTLVQGCKIHGCIHAAYLQVPLSVFKCCTTAARLNPQSVRARGAVALLNALIHQITSISDPSRSLMDSVQQQLQASGLWQQLPTLMQAAQEQLAQASHSTAVGSSVLGSLELQHAHLLLLSFLRMWMRLQPPGSKLPLSFLAPMLPAVMQLVQAVVQRVGVEAQQQKPEADLDVFCPMVCDCFWVVLTLMSEIMEEGGGKMPSTPGVPQAQLLIDSLAPLASIIAMAALAGAMRAGSTMPSGGTSTTSTTSSTSSSSTSSLLLLNTEQHARDSNTGASEQTAGTGTAHTVQVPPELKPVQRLRQADLRAAFDWGCSLQRAAMPSYQAFCDAIGADGSALVLGALALPQRSQILDAMAFLITMWKEHSRHWLQQLAGQAAQQLLPGQPSQLLPGQPSQLQQNLMLHLRLCHFVVECAASVPASHPDYPSRCSVTADLFDGQLLILADMASTVDPWLQSYPPAEWAGGVLARLRQLSEPLLQLSESSLALAAVAGASSTAAAAAQGPAATTGPSSASGDGAGSGGSQGSSTTSTSVREVFSGLNALSLLVGA